MRELKKHTKLRPVLDCKTRWSSLHFMLTRFVAIHTALQTASIVLRKDFPFTISEIKAIERINKILQTAKDAVTTLSARKSNLNTADLAISEAISKLSDTDDLEKKFKKNLIRRYTERRLKHADYLAYLLQHQIPQESNLFFDKTAILDAEIDFLKFTDIIVEIETGTESSSSGKTVIQKSQDVDLDAKPMKKPKRSTFEQSIRHFDLEFEYTSLMKSFVAGLVSIRPTSTEVERVFSIAGFILSDRRTRMSSELFDAIILLNKFYLN